MTTFKKRFTIKGLNGWIDPPERERCGTAIYHLSLIPTYFNDGRKDKTKILFKGN